MHAPPSRPFVPFCAVRAFFGFVAFFGVFVLVAGTIARATEPVPRHWAFRAPVRPPLPAVEHSEPNGLSGSHLDLVEHLSHAFRLEDGRNEVHRAGGNAPGKHEYLAFQTGLNLAAQEFPVVSGNAQRHRFRA